LATLTVTAVWIGALSMTSATSIAGATAGVLGQFWVTVLTIAGGYDLPVESQRGYWESMAEDNYTFKAQGMDLRNTRETSSE
jgi:hypothetical protein